MYGMGKAFNKSVSRGGNWRRRTRASRSVMRWPARRTTRSFRRVHPAHLVGHHPLGKDFPQPVCPCQQRVNLDRFLGDAAELLALVGQLDGGVVRGRFRLLKHPNHVLCFVPIRTAWGGVTLSKYNIGGRAGEDVCGAPEKPTVCLAPRRQIRNRAQFHKNRTTFSRGNNYCLRGKESPKQPAQRHN